MGYYDPPAVGGDKARLQEETAGGLGWLLPAAVAAVLVALLLVFSPILRGGTAPDVVEKASVLVTVKAGQKELQGSGFIFNADGYIATNRHSITGSEAEPQGPVECQVLLHSGTAQRKPLTARVVTWGRGAIGNPDDMANDYAILKVESDSPLPYLKIADSRKAKKTQRVFAAGFPLGSARDSSGNGPGLVIQDGAVRDLLQTRGGGGIAAIDHSARLKPGMSGGPLVDVRGAVLGIDCQTQEAAASNYAIPAHRLADIWRQYGAHGA